jgi:hypothetical protein
MMSETNGFNRRELMTTGAKIGVAIAGASALGGLAASPAAGLKRSRISGVSLPGYPFFDNIDRTMDPAPELLNDLARDYGRHTSNPTMDDFLLGWAPKQLFEDVMSPRRNHFSLAESIWVLHLTGYFGGIWLRLKFEEFGNGRGGAPPTEASFDGLAAQLDEATAAYGGSDAEVLEYVTDRLRGDFFTAGGIVNTYGYNVGYLDQILNGSAPSTVAVPSNYFAFSEDGLFDATYSDGEYQGLGQWRRRSNPDRPWGDEVTALTVGEGGSDDLRAIQKSGIGTGHFTWTLPFLSIEGWDQPSYDSLLATSAGFIQAHQITGMAAIAASARGRADWARRATWANALNRPFAGSYGAGLGDNTYDGMDALEALPQFVY